MIGQIEGKISFLGAGFAIVDVVGVGYKVRVTADAFKALKPGEKAKFWTHLAVREDALDLYGFLEKEEMDFFERLLKVPGVGPKSALSVLSLAPVKTLRRAIASGETAYLTKVSGIGKKTAEKIVFTLKDEVTADESGPLLREEADALEALRSLGYETADARAALKKVPSEVAGLNEKIREALRILGQNS